MAHILKVTAAAILGLISLCVGLIVFTVGAVTLLEGRRLADFAAWAATTATGRQVAIDGPVIIEWGRPTTLTAFGISVANPGWANHANLLEVAQVRARIDPLSLLALNPVFPSLYIQQPAVFLERNQRGETNWQAITGSGSQQQASSSEPGLNLYGLHEFHLVDGNLTYSSPEAGFIQTAKLANIKINAENATSPITIEATAKTEDPMPPDAVPVRISGRVMSLNDLRSAGATYPLHLDISAASSQITADGQITDPFGAMAVDLRLVGHGEDVQTLLAFLNMQLPKQPAYRIEAHMVGSQPRWKAEDILVRLGATEVRGTASLDLSKTRPFIAADLKASPLALEEMRALASGMRTAQQPTGGDLPIEWLNRFDADVSLRAEPIRSPDLPIATATLEMRVRDGTLTAEPLRITGAGGKLDGHLVVKAGAQPPSYSLQATIDQAMLDPLATAFDIAVPVQGTAGGTIDLQATGNTIQDVMSSLTVLANLSVDGQVRQVPIKLSADIGKSGPSSESEIPIRISGNIAETDLSVTGRATVRGQPDVNLQVRVHGPRVEPLLALAGIRNVAAGLDHRLEAAVRYDGSAIRLSDLLAVLGESRVNGSGSLDLSGPEPMIRADLVSPHLSVSEIRTLVPPEGQETPGSPPQNGQSGGNSFIPPTPLPFQWLKSADAQASLRIEELSGSGLPASSINVELSLEDGVLRVKPIKVDFGDGLARTVTTVDATAQPPTLHSETTIEQIALDPLLTAFAVTKKVQGRITGSMTLTSAGTTLDELAAALDGRAQFYLTDGRINTNLVNALALSLSDVIDVLFASDEATPVDCLIGSFDVQDGLIDPQTLMFATPEVVIRGKGRIDLAKERVDLRFTPRPRKQHLFDVSIPIELSGSLSDPNIDLGAALGAQLAKERACRSALDRVSAE